MGDPAMGDTNIYNSVDTIAGEKDKDDMPEEESKPEVEKPKERYMF